MPDKEQGLINKFHVQRVEDPNGKHDNCRYFVLDPQHDPIAREALKAYWALAWTAGYTKLAEDLKNWLASLK